MEKIEDTQLFISSLRELGYDFKEIDEQALVNAPAGLNVENGNAFPGGLAGHVVLTFNLACRLAKLVSTSLPVDMESLKKVCFLHQIAKALMFIPNTNEWEIKRGKVYTFASLEGTLKMGERSALLASNAGIRFTPEEYEAMRILDKSGDEFENQKYLISPLSIILKEANELAYRIEKARFDKKN